MSVIFRTYDSSYLDHREYVNNLYKTVQLSEVTHPFTLNSELFSIKSCKKINHRKRAHDNKEVQEEITAVKQIYETFYEQIPKQLKEEICKKYDLLDTRQVRELSRHLFESVACDHSGINGGNNSDMPVQVKIKDELFLIPQKSRFFCGCVKEQIRKIDSGVKFNIIVADPPWWNKFIRRLKNANEKLSYQMMYNEDIAAIPVKDLVKPNCLVAVWCTNSPSNIAAVKELIFPAWGVTYLTTWYWMKVTIDLEPLCAFGTGHRKQPYERVILGKVGQLTKEPEPHMFMSIPSALHSHKPPLLDLLSPFVDVPNPQVLELFARYLLPNTTSVGFEPLKWQHISLYEKAS